MSDPPDYGRKLDRIAHLLNQILIAARLIAIILVLGFVLRAHN